MKRGYIERLITEAVVEAVKPLVAETQELAAKLVATEAEIAAHTEKMKARAASPAPRPSRWADMFDTGMTVSSWH